MPGAPTETVPLVSDPEELQLIAADALVIAADKAGVLDLLGVFREPTPPPLAPVLQAVDWGTAYERDELLDELEALEIRGEEVLADLDYWEVGLSFEVVEVLESPPEDLWDRIDAGETGLLDAGPYLSAIDDLANRNGRPPTDGVRGGVDGEALAAAYVVAYGGELTTPSGPPTSGQAPPTTLTGGATTSVDGDEASGSDDGPPWLLIALVFVVLGAIVAALLALRRRGPDAGAQFDELLEVSRTLSLARTPADAERIAAEQAARLLGGETSTAGAVVHRATSGLEIGHETLEGVLVPDKLSDGLLRRVVETGQTIVTVVDQEAALRSLPSALVVVPIIGSGRVEGVVLVVRSPDEPFTDDEVSLLTKLGPIAAAALDSARHADESTAASLTDPLTEVGNRRRLENDLPSILLGATGETALAMVDLDHFKSVNDTFGHPAGDALLRAVAAVLQEVVRPGDGVYRYGGEEFALVLPSTDEAAATVVAERARETIASRTYDLGDGVEHRMTASLGVAATVGTDDLDGLGLIARADRALYDAKANGRDRVVAASSLDG